MEFSTRRTLAESFDPAHLPDAFYENPYPSYAALREFAPVHACADGSVFLSRYADLDQVYRDRTHFSSDKRAVFAPKFGAQSPLYAHHTRSLVFNDAPYHTRVRRPLVEALSPQVLRALEPAVAALVDSLIGELRARGSFDLIEDFAARIPVEVIGNLLAVPHAERAPLRGWSLAILGALEPVTGAAACARGNAAVTEFTRYLRTLIEARRRRPGAESDLLTRLLGEPELSEEELVQNCVFLLNAGHETTTNLIGNALVLLLGDPQLTDRLREDDALLKGAVEECLRLESPNQLGNRMVIAPVTVGGVALATGTYLHLCIGAANRDPQEFKDPERLDPMRRPNRHLAFAAGAHACVGMNIARLEAQVALRLVLARLPELVLGEGALRARRARFRGFSRLPGYLR
jgi:cytochrome P450